MHSSAFSPIHSILLPSISFNANLVRPHSNYIIAPLPVALTFSVSRFHSCSSIGFSTSRPRHLRLSSLLCSHIHLIRVLQYTSNPSSNSSTRLFSTSFSPNPILPSATSSSSPSSRSPSKSQLRQQKQREEAALYIQNQSSVASNSSSSAHKRNVNPQISRLDGLIGVNKPSGMNSSRVVRIVERMLSVDRNGNLIKPTVKVGHSGTLDELASGLLVLGIGKGCKQLQMLLSGSKSYIGEGCLGSSTDTQDKTGKVIREAPFAHVTKEQLQSVISTMTGTIMQTPPHSLKIGGRRASSLVRSGKSFEIPPRPITLYSFHLLHYSPPDPHFTIEVHCSGGTYIRTLIHDIGSAVGSAAMMTALKRTSVGQFQLDSKYTIHLPAELPEDTKEEYAAKLSSANITKEEIEKILALPLEWRKQEQPT